MLVANSEAYGTKSEYGANGSKGPCGYLWRKYLDIEEYRTNNGFGTKSVCTLSYPLMRLAELYLIRAEANIEWAGGDLGVAKADIETIRGRAHMPVLTVSDATGCVRHCVTSAWSSCATKDSAGSTSDAGALPKR